MDSFNKTNLQNIKDIFEEKTGVALETRRRRQPIRAAMLVAAVLVCSLTMTAFAVSLFSSLSGDDLSLSATYEGMKSVFSSEIVFRFEISRHLFTACVLATMESHVFNFPRWGSYLSGCSHK